MPTILRLYGYRFFFYSLEGSEPTHIHIEKGDCVAKYWLRPVQLASNYGFKSPDLVKLNKIVNNNRYLFLEKWNEYFKC